MLEVLGKNLFCKSLFIQHQETLSILKWERHIKLLKNHSRKHTGLLELITRLECFLCARSTLLICLPTIFQNKKGTNLAVAKQLSTINLHPYLYLKANISTVTHCLKIWNNCLPAMITVSLQDNIINFECSFEALVRNFNKEPEQGKNTNNQLTVPSAFQYKTMIGLIGFVEQMKLSKRWGCLLGFGVTKKVVT